MPVFSLGLQVMAWIIVIMSIHEVISESVEDNQELVKQVHESTDEDLKIEESTHHRYPYQGSFAGFPKNPYRTPPQNEYQSLNFLLPPPPKYNHPASFRRLPFSPSPVDNGFSPSILQRPLPLSSQQYPTDLYPPFRGVSKQCLDPYYMYLLLNYMRDFGFGLGPGGIFGSTGSPTIKPPGVFHNVEKIDRIKRE